MKKINVILNTDSRRSINTMRIIKKAQIKSLKKRYKKEYQQNYTGRQQKKIRRIFAIILEHSEIVTEITTTGKFVKKF